MSKRKYVFYTNWNKNDLNCACLFHNPLCDKWKACEELELTLNPYEDVKEVMKANRYVRGKGGAKKQK